MRILQFGVNIYHATADDLLRQVCQMHGVSSIRSMSGRLFPLFFTSTALSYSFKHLQRLVFQV